ncbi:MAG: hypothetical protein GXO07_00580 [Crenarchaeota archaeon]|nr:hypothetical protein [Thermoproteota archaeon]
MRVKAFEGLPLEAEGAEDPEMVAAFLGEIGEIMKRLGIKVVKLEGEVVVGEG